MAVVKIHPNISMGDDLILEHDRYGFVRAVAAEDWNFLESPGPLVRVHINSESLPGIPEAVINTNEWGVYSSEDPKILKKIADHFVKREYVR